MAFVTTSSGVKGTGVGVGLAGIAVGGLGVAVGSGALEQPKSRVANANAPQQSTEPRCGGEMTMHQRIPLPFATLI